MRRSPVPTGPPPLLLATDLDGTFAGGADPDRHALYARLVGRLNTRLCYATGRHLASAQALQDALGLPVPELYIADVGATVAAGDSRRAVGFPDETLTARWPGAERVGRRLASLGSVLAPQRLPVDRRLSYVVRDGARFTDVVARVRLELAELDVEVVASAGTYVDILPGGVNKGATLRRVVEWLRADPASVVVAGDSLNDLALLQAGYRGIVVGNAEPPLRETVGRVPRVYCAQGHGALGVHEGLRHFGFLNGEACAVQLGDSQGRRR